MASPTQETERKRLNKQLKKAKTRSKRTRKALEKLRGQGRLAV